MIFAFLHVALVSVAETTYLVVSLKNGAPWIVLHGPRRP
jgi:hypothetical protein